MVVAAVPEEVLVLAGAVEALVLVVAAVPGEGPVPVAALAAAAGPVQEPTPCLCTMSARAGPSACKVRFWMS